jgi:glutaconate CoA-transferase, subunit A
MAPTETMKNSKLVPLAQAISDHLADGATVFIGGFGHAVPFAAAHEFIRQGKRDLTLCRSGADILFDQAIAAGCVKKVIFGYIGNPGVGLARSFSRALAAGEIEMEEWTNFSMVLRLHAARLGVPFLPAEILRAGDIAGGSIEVRSVTCPYTGRELSAIPALRPDVALIHAQRADEAGNVQFWGIDGDTREGALAADKIIATVEEIVPSDVIASSPERTMVPAHRVAAISLAPGGAHPSYIEDYYDRDDAHFNEYDDIARKPESMTDYLDKYVHGVTDRAGYLSLFDSARLEKLGLADKAGRDA